MDAQRKFDAEMVEEICAAIAAATSPHAKFSVRQKQELVRELFAPPPSAPVEAVDDAEWPRALARLRATEPHPDQGIACVGTRDLEMALERLEQFANVALGNAIEISRLMAEADHPTPPVPVEAVAWTHPVQLSLLKNSPRQAAAMWGEPNGQISTPLYTHPTPPAVERLKEALKPFATFAENVDENGWKSNIHKERISYWFGPTDFRRAAEALATFQEVGR